MASVLQVLLQPVNLVFVTSMLVLVLVDVATYF
jgi:hypothetical protein